MHPFWPGILQKEETAFACDTTKKPAWVGTMLCSREPEFWGGGTGALRRAHIVILAGENTQQKQYSLSDHYHSQRDKGDCKSQAGQVQV